MPWTANEVDSSEENEILLTTEQATDMSALHLLHKERSANQGNPKHFFPQ